LQIGEVVEDKETVGDKAREKIRRLLKIKKQWEIKIVKEEDQERYVLLFLIFAFPSFN